MTVIKSILSLWVILQGICIDLTGMRAKNSKITPTHCFFLFLKSVNLAFGGKLRL